jgi:CRP-like cAMP-binding protein
MESKHLHKLAAMAREVTFEADEMIYRRGDQGDAVFLVETGQVVIDMETPTGERATMHTAGPGQFFGWSSIFPRERKMAWTRAAEPTRAIAFDAAQLREAMQADHELEYALVRRASRVTANRIQASRQQLADLFRSVPQE